MALQRGGCGILYERLVVSCLKGSAQHDIEATDRLAMVKLGLGCIVALHYCSSTSYQICYDNQYLYF